jgi:hypothetical protein
MVLIPVPRAVAGGPTSALVTAPAAGAVKALHHEDAEYTLLEERLTRARPPGGGGPQRPPGGAEAPGHTLLTVTWLAHDVSPWRLHRVVLGSASDDVWVNTRVPHDGGGTEWIGSEGDWHRADSGGGVRALLGELGFAKVVSTGDGKRGSAPGRSAAGTPGRDGSGAGDPGRPAGRSAAGPAADAASGPDADRTQQASRAGSPGASTGWWWLLPGLAAGTTVGLLAHRLPRPGLRTRARSSARLPES